MIIGVLMLAGVTEDGFVVMPVVCVSMVMIGPLEAVENVPIEGKVVKISTVTAVTGSVIAVVSLASTSISTGLAKMPDMHRQALTKCNKFMVALSTSH